MSTRRDDLPVLVIDGAAFSDLDGFAREFSRPLCHSPATSCTGRRLDQPSRETIACWRRGAIHALQRVLAMRGQLG